MYKCVPLRVSMYMCVALRVGMYKWFWRHVRCAAVLNAFCVQPIKLRTLVSLNLDANF